MGLLSVIYYLVPSVLLARGVLLIQFALGCVSLTLWRSFLYWAIGRDVLTRNLVILGTGEFAVDLARAVVASNSKGQKIVRLSWGGSCARRPIPVQPQRDRYAGRSGCPRQRMRIDTVVVALGDNAAAFPWKASP